MDSNQIIRILKADGWVVHNSKGSHVTLKKTGVSFIITLSHPVKDVKIGQLKNAERISGLKF